MIIDGHTFIGNTIYINQNSDEVIHKMNKYNIDISVVTAPPPGPFYEEANKLVEKEAMNNNEHFIALYRCNPHLENEIENLRINLEKEIFKGVKLDPTNDGYGIGDTLEDIMNVVEEYDKPVYIQSGDSIFCPPEYLAYFAKKHQNIKFITPRSRRASYAFENIENIYLMSRPFPAINFQRGHEDFFDLDRLIFATDSPVGNHNVELTAVKESDLDEKVYKKIMAENIKKIFSID